MIENKIKLLLPVAIPLCANANAGHPLAEAQQRQGKTNAAYQAGDYEGFTRAVRLKWLNVRSRWSDRDRHQLVRQAISRRLSRRFAVKPS